MTPSEELHEDEPMYDKIITGTIYVSTTWDCIAKTQPTYVKEPEVECKDATTTTPAGNSQKKDHASTSNSKESKHAMLRSTTIYLYDEPPQTSGNSKNMKNDHGESSVPGKESECTGMIMLDGCIVSLVPDTLKPENYYKKDYPIKIFNPYGAALQRSDTCYLFFKSAIEKEDWYLLLKKAAALGSLEFLKDSTVDSSRLIDENAKSEKERQLRDLEARIAFLEYKRVNESDELVQRHDYFSHLKQLIANRGTGLVEAELKVLPNDRSYFNEDYFARLDASSQWFNALMGRIFYNIFQSEWLQDYFMKKLSRKTSKLKRPSYMGDVVVTDITVGDGFPLFSQFKLHELSKDGELWFSMFTDYDGHFKITVNTNFKFDYLRGLSFDVILSCTIQHVSGRMLVRLKEPPSDRLWMGFYGLPKLKLHFEPIVSSKAIKWSVLNSLMEKRVIDILNEYAVLPNMEDFLMPEYKSRWFGDEQKELEIQREIWKRVNSRETDVPDEPFKQEENGEKEGSTPVTLVESLNSFDDKSSRSLLPRKSTESINSVCTGTSGHSGRTTGSSASGNKASRIIKSFRSSVSNFAKNYWRKSTADGEVNFEEAISDTEETTGGEPLVSRALSSSSPSFGIDEGDLNEDASRLLRSEETVSDPSLYNGADAIGPLDTQIFDQNAANKVVRSGALSRPRAVSSYSIHSSAFQHDVLLKFKGNDDSFIESGSGIGHLIEPKEPTFSTKSMKCELRSMAESVAHLSNNSISQSSTSHENGATQPSSEEQETPLPKKGNEADEEAKPHPPLPSSGIDE